MLYDDSVGYGPYRDPYAEPKKAKQFVILSDCFLSDKEQLEILKSLKVTGFCKVSIWDVYQPSSRSTLDIVNDNRKMYPWYIV
jgi:hypothetical protein